MEYVLIVFMYAGMLSRGDSVSLTNISGFETKQFCEEAGDKVIKEFKNEFKTLPVGYKSGKYVCVRKK